MAKRGLHKYLVPYGEKASVDDDFICVSFFCPSEWFAVSALIGSFASLAKSTMWHDDAESQRIAEKFKEAYYLSFKDDFMCKVINNINVECGSGCGCGSGSGSGFGEININVPASGSVDDLPADNSVAYGPAVNSGSGTADVPEPLQANYANAIEYNEALCRMSNMVADRWMSALNMVSASIDSSAEFSVGSILTAIGLAIVDGPLPIGDILAITIVIAPWVRLWLKKRGFSGDSFIDAFFNVDKASMVAIIYNGSGQGSISDSLRTYINDIISSSAVPDELKTLATAYTDYTLGNRFTAWAFDTILPSIASDYPMSVSCPISQSSGSVQWLFQSGTLEGWEFIPSNAGPIEINASGVLPGLVDPSGGYVGAYPLLASGGKNIVLDRTDLNFIVGADTGIGIRSNPTQGGLNMYVVFADGSTYAVNKTNDNTNGGIVPFDLSAHAGKVISRINVKTGNYQDDTTELMAIDSIIIGDSAGQPKVGVVTRTS